MGRSVAGPGQAADLVALQRSPALKNEVPRVIRPDLLITEHGLSVTELDSVPGGIGLTGWLNQTYSAMGAEVLVFTMADLIVEYIRTGEYKP